MRLVALIFVVLANFVNSWSWDSETTETLSSTAPPPTTVSVSSTEVTETEKTISQEKFDKFN